MIHRVGFRITGHFSVIGRHADESLERRRAKDDIAALLAEHMSKLSPTNMLGKSYIITIFDEDDGPQGTPQ